MEYFTMLEINKTKGLIIWKTIRQGAQQKKNLKKNLTIVFGQPFENPGEHQSTKTKEHHS
jgi:hypothetical protein